MFDSHFNASNGQTSTQIPHDMQRAKSILNSSRTLINRGRAIDGEFGSGA
jgi:hypothetical protein